MIWDLREKSECHRKEALSQKFENDNEKYKPGDVIEFYAGYNMDIRMRAEIAGTIGEELYLIWDCYWFPIRANDVNRKINLVNFK